MLPITALKGVGPKLKDKLEQRLGWRTVQDWLGFGAGKTRPRCSKRPCL